MVDQFKEVTTTSWGQRIIGSFGGLVIGLILFIAAFPLIFWNEGRSVDRIKTLHEGRGMVVSASADNVDPANDGKLIHVSGDAATADVLNDSGFGVSENALKLRRKVEMFQWQEDKQSKSQENMGGGESTETTYTYKKVWSEDLIDSSSFKKPDGHDNPSQMPFTSQDYSSDNVTVGAYQLSKPFIEQISEFEPYRLTQTNYDAMDQDLKDYMKLSGGQYVHGDADNPEIGAMRVSYGIIKPGPISVIGKQNDGSVQPYETQNGTISLLQTGNVDASAMFAAAESDNAFWTWLLRLGAFLMMWMGLTAFFGPVRMIAAVVPMFAQLVDAGIGLVTFVTALVLSLVAIALAWIVFRPLIGLGLLIVAGGFFFFGYKKIKERLAKKAASTPAPAPAAS